MGERQQAADMSEPDRGVGRYQTSSSGNVERGLDTGTEGRLLTQATGSKEGSLSEGMTRQ